MIDVAADNFFQLWSQRTDWCVVDTETTGVDTLAQVIEIAVIDAGGRSLVNTLIKPTVPIHPVAKSTHGINGAMVRGAPAFADILPALLSAFTGRHVLAYNATFDRRVLVQTYRAHRAQGTIDDNIETAERWQCVMKAFTRHHGQRVSLDKAAVIAGLAVDLQHADRHRAWGDAFLTHRLVHTLGRQPELMPTEPGNEKPDLFGQPARAETL